jgi:LacI family transcriptional regulator
MNNPSISRSAPPVDLLREIVLDVNRDLPLHAQLRLSLERLIQEKFADQARFYSEAQLIKALGISQGTIRRALNDLATQGLLEKRPARGTVVCKEFKPSGLFNLAVFLPDYSSRSISQILGHINAECLNRNIRLQPIYTHRGERLLKAYSNLKFSPQEGGVVLLENSPRATTELLSALEDKGHNCVVIGTLLRDHSYKFVGGCNQTVMELGLSHLVQLGHRKISLLVNEPEEIENVQERITAFKYYAERQEHPLEAKVFHCGTRLWEDSRGSVDTAMEELMKEGNRPTAIFAVSDFGAIGAIQWLQQRGIRVPEDISVMGADGIDLGDMIHPKLTTLEHPFEEMAETVFELLENRESRLRKIFVKPSLKIRESTMAIS